MTHLFKPVAAALSVGVLAALVTGCADVPGSAAQSEYRGEVITGSHLRRHDVGAARILGRDELERIEAMRPGVLDPPPGIPPPSPRL